MVIVTRSSFAYDKKNKVAKTWTEFCILHTLATLMEERLEMMMAITNSQM